MDRREALKKLAAGSAVAVGASVVLTSTAVAATASIGDTGVVGFPVPPAELPFLVTSDSGGNKVIDVAIDTSGISCEGGGTLTILYGWRLISRSNNDIILILPSTTISTITSFTSPNSIDTSIEITDGGKGNPSLNGQTYSFGLLTEAFCAAGQPYVRTEYVFNGAGGSVTQIPGEQTIVG